MNRRLGQILRVMIALSLSIGLLQFAAPPYLAHATPSWSSPILVDPEPYHATDILTSSAQLSNGTIVLTWQSNRNGANGRTDVFYKSYSNSVWSGDTSLTSNGWNSGPSLVQFLNGTIMVVWAYKAQGNYVLYSTSNSNGHSWSSPTRVTSTTLNDTQPSAAVGRDGTVWLVWTRVNSTNQSGPAGRQLYYKTWKSGVWAPEVQLTNDANQNFGSSVTITKDGTVWVAWSKGVAGNNYQIYYKTFNGITWTSDTPLTTSSSSQSDEHPSLLQDRNGTLWLFWGRIIIVSTLIQYYDLFSKYSYNLGQSWSSDSDMTNNSAAGTVDSQMPSAIQSTIGVKPIWVFYSSNLNVNDLDIYAMTSSGIGPVHDVTISGISSSNNLGTNWEYPGGLRSVGQSAIVTITVTIQNIGDYLETATMTLTAKNTTNITIGTSSSLIGPGNAINFYYYWNTTNVNPARYGLTAAIAALPGESLGNMGDNTFAVSNRVHIIPLGDIDQDGNIDANDASVAIFDYGATPGSPRWNPYVDIQNNGFIDANDISFIIFHYGTFT